MKKLSWLTSLLFITSFYALAQDCNCVASSTDLTVTTGQTVVLNAYYPGNSSALAGSTSITLGAKRTFTGPTDNSGTISTGDVLLVIQIQGAEIDATIPDMETIDVAGADNFNSTDYGDGPGGLDHEGFLDNGSFIAGQYEFVIATNAVGAGGGTLTIQKGLTSSYIANATPSGNIGKQSYQVIKVGNYNDLTIQAGAEVTTIPWNGSTGGIISLDVLGTLDLDGTIDANFAGFRGGLLDPAIDNNDVEPGWRGEGIAGSPTQVYHYNDDFSALTSTRGLATGYPGGSATVNSDFDYGTGVFSFNMTYTNERGPGAPGNAGGAGLVNNGGGGGSSGGPGGSGATSGDGAGGDFLIPAGGGQQLSLELGNKLFLGGGGGTGGMATPDNTGFPIEVQSGHPGGGAILIRADVLTGTGTVTANGDDGGSFNATGTNQADEDGAGGGGGAAGTIILVTSSEDITGITFNAIGGDGSSLTGVQQFASPDGGGGGGSGGNVTLVRRGASFSPTPTNIDVTGGAAGGTQGTPSAQSEGGAGATELLTTPPASNLDCPLITLPAPAPGGVSGAIIWFEPNNGVTYNGSNQISAWNDLSSSNFTMTNTAVTGISGTNPDWIPGSFTGAEASSNPEFNFNPSISFNEGLDNTDYLAFNSFSNISTGAITVFTVANLPAIGPNDQTFFSYLPNDSQDDELDLGVSNDGGSDGIRKSVLDNAVDRSGDIRDGVTRIITGDYDNTDVNIYLNNGAATNSALTAGTLDVDGTFVIGQDIDDFGTPAFDTNRELQGQIGDIIYFSRALTDAERRQVTSYLSLKYGITMDQAVDQDYLNSIGEAIYPVASESANYAFYDNDIAGIGRDDGSGFSQLRSKSINPDAILTGSLSSGFSIDRQYVIWGNNNGGTTFNTAEISAGITDRIQREWRMAAANSPGPINLTFDLSGTTNTPLVSDNVAIVIDDDGDFSNGFLRTVSANSWDGATATFNNVMLNDDEVITIAEVPPTPGGVTGLSLWLKVDAGVSETGGSVSAWADQSGNGNNATSVNNPTLISNALNSYDIIDFDGANDIMDGAAGFYTQSYFIVAQPDVAVDGTANGFLLGFEDGASTFSGFLLGTNVDGYVPSDRIVHIVGANGDGDEYRSGRPDGTFTAADEPVIYSSVNNSTVTEQEIYSNGTDIVPEQYANALKNLSDEQYRLGNNYSGSNLYDGGIAEVISFSNALDVNDREKIQSYLAIKYGITLDGSEADYIASDGDFIYETVVIPADYNNDITGIGRDDISVLDQRSSTSVNADAVVTMAITDNGGTFASPNAFTQNLSFLAWGNDNDDNGTIEDVTTEVPSNVITRLDREWRVQEKGTVGNVTIQVDLTGIDPDGVETDFTGRTAESFMLLVDDGGDFSNGISNSFAATSYDAVNEVITFDVDFSDGNIFTVATSMAPTGPGGVTTNLALWLRPDRDVLNTGGGTAADGEEVGTWTDQLGALDFTRDAIGTVTAAGPTFNASDAEFNGNPSLEWNASGNGDYLARAGFNFPTTDFTLFTTQRIDAVNENNSFVLGYFEAARILEQRNMDNVSLRINNANANSGEDATDFTSITTFEYDQSSPSYNLNLNGSASASNAVAANSTAVIGGGGTLLLGERMNGALNSFVAARQLVGKLADIIIYDGLISTTERDRVESYLATKYGVTMNGGDYDYQSSAGTVYFPGNSDADYASFRTDVGIIGRDDNSDFEQLSSGSVNTTGVLTITKNVTFSADDQFISWAHNGSAESQSTATDFPSGIEGRSDRVWKMKLTNNPDGTVDLTFDLSSVTVDQAADLRLLVDSDGDFSDATVLNPTVSQNGNNYTFSGVNLSSFSDGDFFTFGTIDVADSPLPLNWLSFIVSDMQGRAGLKWETTNEINVSHFVIERSANGVDFEAIGDVIANNVSDAINSYEYMDISPYLDITYYRVKQIDFDGQYDYTQIEYLVRNGAAWEVRIYPNPVNDIMNITSSLPSGGRFKVVNLAGQVVIDYPILGSQQNAINLSGLTPGIYQFEYESPLGVSRIKFIKN